MRERRQTRIYEYEYYSTINIQLTQQIFNVNTLKCIKKERKRGGHNRLEKGTS